MRIVPWLWRGLAIVVLTMVVALWVMAQPVSAPNPPEPTATQTPIPTATPTPTPTSTPSPIPTWTPMPTWTPTPTPEPTDTPTPIPTDTPAPTATPTLTETVVSEIATETPSDPTVEQTMVVSPTVGPPPLAGRIEEHTYASQLTGVDESYRIYLPPDYDQTERRYPVLYLLHGWPVASSDWGMLGAPQLADATIVAGTLPAFIIVMPRGSEALYIRTSGGSYSFEAQLINDLMPHIDATYRTWPAREGRAIGGISRGGVWSLEISFMHPDLFGIVGAHSPALSVNLAPPAYDPFNLMTLPGVPTLRIYLDTGDADWTRRSTELLHQKLDEQGIVHAYAVHAGRHDANMWASALGEYLLFYAGGWWDIPQ